MRLCKKCGGIITSEGTCSNYLCDYDMMAEYKTRILRALSMCDDIPNYMANNLDLQERQFTSFIETFAYDDKGEKSEQMLIEIIDEDLGYSIYYRNLKTGYKTGYIWDEEREFCIPLKYNGELCPYTYIDFVPSIQSSGWVILIRENRKTNPVLYDSKYDQIIENVNARNLFISDLTFPTFE